MFGSNALEKIKIRELKIKARNLRRAKGKKNQFVVVKYKVVLKKRRTRGYSC